MRNHRAIHAPDSEDACHIASLIVLCRPECLVETEAAITALPTASVPEADPLGKLIVLLEASGEGELVNSIRDIEQLPGVISASMVFHQID